jgi:hypothetical protein
MVLNIQIYVTLICNLFFVKFSSPARKTFDLSLIFVVHATFLAVLCLNSMPNFDNLWKRPGDVLNSSMVKIVNTSVRVYVLQMYSIYSTIPPFFYVIVFALM